MFKPDKKGKPKRQYSNFFSAAAKKDEKKPKIAKAKWKYGKTFAARTFKERA